LVTAAIADKRAELAIVMEPLLPAPEPFVEHEFPWDVLTELIWVATFQLKELPSDDPSNKKTEHKHAHRPRR
jgi:hypothetical protein